MTKQTSPYLILLVDDDQGLRILSKKCLERAGFVTAETSSGKETLDWLGQNQADLMVLDYKLPDMFGKELADMTGLPVLAHLG